MKTIFDKNNNGTSELVEALGMIDAATDFSKWKPLHTIKCKALNSYHRAGSLRQSGRILSLYGARFKNRRKV